MADQHVLEICRRAFSGFAANDRAPLRALLSDDVVFEFPRTVPYGGVYDGAAAYDALWSRIYRDYYSSFDYDLVALIDGGDRIVAQVVARATSKAGGVLDYEQCIVLSLADGLIVAGKVYADSAALCAFLVAEGLDGAA